MLVLARKPNEKIVFPGINTTVEVVAIKHGVVRLGIDAPREVKVLREELVGSNTGAAAAAAAAPEGRVVLRLSELDRLLQKRLGIAEKGLVALREQLLSGLNLDVLLSLEEVQAELHALRERIRSEVQEGRGAPVPAHRTKALLVEDNAQERQLMALFLRSQGLDVDTAGDGCDALDYLKASGNPDVVLLDMGLPRLDGAATVHQIRNNPACAGLKIFAVSGHSADEYQMPIGPAGVDGWFQKPIDPATLVRDLNRALDSRC